MLSKIKIDIDFDNQPIIVLDYKESDDLRDKLIKRFIEGFKHESNIASVSFEENIIKIRPTV